MTKYFNLYTGADTATVLLNANAVKSIVQTSATETTISYSAAAGTDVVTITHASDSTEVAVQNSLIDQLRVLMATGYQNAAPLYKLPVAYVSIAVA